MAQQFNQLNADVTLKQHQLWFLKSSESQADQEKLKADSDKAVLDLEARLADLRHLEADLEATRQAHYEAGDRLNQAQGQLYEASAEVGRLEAEIRFVVEGRQRVESRLVSLKDQQAQWQQRIVEASQALEALDTEELGAAQQSALLQSQLEEQSGVLPDLEDAWRQAQRASADQRAGVVQVQQQIQVLAAEQRSLDEQVRAAEALSLIHI